MERPTWIIYINIAYRVGNIPSKRALKLRQGDEREKMHCCSGSSPNLNLRDKGSPLPPLLENKTKNITAPTWHAMRLIAPAKSRYEQNIPPGIFIQVLLPACGAHSLRWNQFSGVLEYRGCRYRRFMAAVATWRLRAEPHVAYNIILEWVILEFSGFSLCTYGSTSFLFWIPWSCLCALLLRNEGVAAI